MKIAIFLTVTIAVTLVSAHPVEKRQFGDFFRNITAAGADALSDLFDFASHRWSDLRKRIQDYDIGGRIAEIRQRVRDRYGPLIDRITNLQFDDIARAARDVIGDARDVLHIDDIVGRIRKALGREVDDVSDDDIGDIVGALQDDVAAIDDDVGLGKRDLRDSLLAAFRNITSAGRDRLSDLLDDAGRALSNLRQRIRDYNIEDRLANIRQRVRARVGDIVDSFDDTTFGDIARAARDTINDAAGAIGLDTFVQRIRDLLQGNYGNVPDDDIKQIAQAVQDDVADSG